ncbi:hypothetical protein [Candidatus Thiodiazotropha sp. CDECU1]|uniref:hypothetical protein n=1 Tax=Candidatus Thiodiazotropha sp. CDECU1 TaxID=3065865 RepID=UPI00292F3DE0|nr:hypothetical protein [Candidatus Thiodiazotropha sp. CDECU1]
MKHYKPTRLRWKQVLARFIRGIAGLLERWPLLLLAVVIVSPVGPHLRWEYSYREIGQHRIYLKCEYFGTRGVVAYRRGSECPLLVLIDLREVGRW